MPVREDLNSKIEARRACVVRIVARDRRCFFGFFLSSSHLMAEMLRLWNGGKIVSGTYTKFKLISYGNFGSSGSHCELVVSFLQSVFDYLKIDIFF